MSNKKESSPVERSAEVITIDIQPFLTPIAIIISALIISVSILVGANMIKGSGGVAKTATTGSTVTPTATGGTAEEFPSVTTSIDDDAYIGNKDTAKIAIVEFSDFNCSFCARHHSEVFNSLVEKYVNSGQAILVYRDFPGVGGATTAAAANAAECFREQAGNSKYFDLIKEIYATSGTKDTNLIVSLSSKYGVDKGNLESCISSNKYTSEVDNDLKQAQAIGIGGTPGFVVGKLNSDGSVEGKMIGGAYPLDTFDQIASEYLN